MRCIVIEDEPLARDVIVKFVNDHPELTLESVCKDAFEGLSALETQPVDLIFLDINMPGLSGINFYKSLSRRPLVIFTTAYPDHAVEGFELDAVDYLLKPFSFERFVKAVNKAKGLVTTSSEPDRDFIMLKADKKTHKVNFSQALLFESIGDYVKAHLADGRVLIINETLKYLEEILPAKKFTRIHKSFIINLSGMEYIEGNRMMIGERMVPIGQSYREKINRLFQGKK